MFSEGKSLQEAIMSLAAMSKAPGECMISCAKISQIPSCIFAYVALLLRALRAHSCEQSKVAKATSL